MTGSNPCARPWLLTEDKLVRTYEIGAEAHPEGATTPFEMTSRDLDEHMRMRTDIWLFSRSDRRIV